MIFLIYGKNDQETQKQIKKIQKTEKPNEIINIELEEVTPVEFGDLILTPNIFGYKNLVIGYGGKLGQKELTRFLNVSKNKSENTSVIFFTSQELKSNSKVVNQVKKMDHSKIIKVKEEKDYTIFNFLDAVYNKNRKKSYQMLEELMEKGESPQKIHSMLIYQLRKMAKVSYGGKIKSPDFVKRKLKGQATKFTKEEIINLYQHFYETDRDMKLGLIPDNILNIINIEKILKNTS